VPPLAAPDSPVARLAWWAGTSGMGWYLLGLLVLLVVVWAVWR